MAAAAASSSSTVWQHGGSLQTVKQTTVKQTVDVHFALFSFAGFEKDASWDQETVAKDLLNEYFHDCMEGVKVRTFSHMDNVTGEAF